MMITDSDQARPIPEPTLRRLPTYHHFLKTLEAEGREAVSCSTMGRELNLDPTQIRKDLAMTGITGRPKIGYVVTDLIGAIESFLGWNDVQQAFLAGVGNLGAALLGYQQFNRYGLDIVAAFDTDEAKIGRQGQGKEVMPLSKMADLARRMHVHLGIITTPAEHAQYVADQMVAGGIEAIWNFAPIVLSTPEHIIVQDEDLFSSLAVLSRRLRTRLQAMQ